MSRPADDRHGTHFPLGEKGGHIEKIIKPIRIPARWQDNTIYIIEYSISDNAKKTE